MVHIPQLKHFQLPQPPKALETIQVDFAAPDKYDRYINTRTRKFCLGRATYLHADHKECEFSDRTCSRRCPRTPASLETPRLSDLDTNHQSQGSS